VSGPPIEPGSLLVAAQHVCADCASNHSSNGTQRSTTEFVSKECTAGASYERRSETTLTFSGTTGCARRAELALWWSAVAVLLVSITLLLPMLAAILLRLGCVLLVGSLMLLVLRRWWVGGVTAVRVVALVVLALGGRAIAVLLGSLIGIMRWCPVLALWPR
jgi:hypothetical protein